jgi:DNA polymerase-3 subunit delta
VISLVNGENSFENERQLGRIIADFDGEILRIDGETLEIAQLPNLFMGATLFATKRLVIIKNLSANKVLWNQLEQWVEKANDEDTHVVLVDEKPDKRTKTYKLLQKTANVHESKLWTDRDQLKAEQWVIEEANQLSFMLDKKCAHKLVEWVGVNQWTLHQALLKLSVLDTVTPEVIEQIIEPNLSENAFFIFETALNGKGVKVMEMLATLRTSEDPYRLFGLLSSQVFQLVTLAVATVSEAEVASDLGVHPFAISKLHPYAKKIGKDGAKSIIEAFAEADTAMKTSAGDPWVLIERALMKTIKTIR